MFQMHRVSPTQMFLEKWDLADRFTDRQINLLKLQKELDGTWRGVLKAPKNQKTYEQLNSNYSLGFVVSSFMQELYSSISMMSPLRRKSASTHGLVILRG